MRRRSVAVVTSSSAGPVADDDALAAALGRAGAAARIVSWDDPSVDWAGFSAAVVRSTWDYHRRVQEFLAWVESTGRVTRLLNPPRVLAWNTHKSYLVELARRGVPIVPTWIGDLRDWAAREETLASHGWTAAIVKPAVSASADRTFRVELGKPLPVDLAALLPARDTLVQPYLRSVETDGELSLVYLGGELSHTVRKIPRAGDFRSQAEFGGTVERIEPPKAACDLAGLALRQVAVRVGEAPIVYARVDLLADDRGDLLLGELELVEPGLHLLGEEGAADRLAAAVLDVSPG